MDMKVLSELAGAIQMPAAAPQGPWSTGFGIRLASLSPCDTFSALRDIG